MSTEVNEVFGGRTRSFRLTWLLPTAVEFPDSLHDDILGFQVSQSR